MAGLQTGCFLYSPPLVSDVSDTTIDLFTALQTALGPQYRLERELGRGGMGVVFLATDTALDRRVAIKVVHPELAAHESITRRFLAEARTIARLRHPNIVAVHAAGSAQGLLYYVMDEVAGESLRQKLLREGRFSAGETGRILSDLAAALDASGRAGVVHRDVKPENVLLDEATGRAMLADFGIARAVAVEASGSSTGQGVAVGTPVYMSPEQAAGEEIDTRSDLYALGVVAYEMLTGQPPFQGPHRVVVSKHIAERPVPVERLRPGDAARAGRCGDAGAGETAVRAVANWGRVPPGSGGRAAYTGPHPADHPADHRGGSGRAGPAGRHCRPGSSEPRAAPGRQSASLHPGPALRQPARRAFGRMAEGRQRQHAGTQPVPVERSHGGGPRAAARPARPSTVSRSATTSAWTWRDGWPVRPGCGRWCWATSPRRAIHCTSRRGSSMSPAASEWTSRGWTTAVGSDVRPLFDDLAAKLLDLSGAPNEIRIGLARSTTQSLEAFRAYLRGVEHLNRWDLAGAQRDLERAIALDTTFGLAYYKLALTRGWVGGTEDSVGRRAIRRATTFSGNLPPARACGDQRPPRLRAR